MMILNGQQTKFDQKYTSKASASGELIKAIYLLVSAKQDNNINLKDKLGNQNKKSLDISKIVQVTVKNQKILKHVMYITFKYV